MEAASSTKTNHTEDSPVNPGLGVKKTDLAQEDTGERTTTTINLDDLIQSRMSKEEAEKQEKSRRDKKTTKKTKKGEKMRRPEDTRTPPAGQKDNHYCWICGKGYRGGWELKRHEESYRHKKEQEEYIRLSNLPKKEDPNQQEYWESNEEPDWQKNPTHASKLYEELLERDEQVTWYTFLQEIEKTDATPSRKQNIPEIGKDPRIGDSRHTKTATIEEELDTMLQDPVNEEKMMQEVQRLADIFLTPEEQTVAETIINITDEDLEEGEIRDEENIPIVRPPETPTNAVEPVGEKIKKKTQIKFKPTRPHKLKSNLMIRSIKKSARRPPKKLNKKMTLKKKEQIEFYPWDRMTFDDNKVSTTRRRLQLQDEMEYKEYKHFEDRVWERIFGEDGGWVTLDQTGTTEEVLKFQHIC
jgi:hypothetical protein